MKKLITIVAAILCAGAVYAQDLATATETFNNGVTANEAGNVEMALQNFKEALVMAEGLGEAGADIVANCKSSIPILMFSLAKKAVNESEYDKAVAGLKETIEVATKYGVDNVADEATVLIPQVLMQKANGFFNDKEPPSRQPGTRQVQSRLSRQLSPMARTRQLASSSSTSSSRMQPQALRLRSMTMPSQPPSSPTSTEKTQRLIRLPAPPPPTVERPSRPSNISRSTSSLLPMQRTQGTSSSASQFPTSS